MGFLTHDSQAGDEGERATVQGLMRYDRACAFTQLLNRMGDKVLYRHQFLCTSSLDANTQTWTRVAKTDSCPGTFTKINSRTV
jgi:hypothetical protein